MLTYLDDEEKSEAGKTALWYAAEVATNPASYPRFSEKKIPRAVLMTCIDRMLAEYADRALYIDFQDFDKAAGALVHDRRETLATGKQTAVITKLLPIPELILFPRDILILIAMCLHQVPTIPIEYIDHEDGDEDEDQGEGDELDGIEGDFKRTSIA